VTFTFRTVTPDDFALLADWRRRPHVVKWWGDKSVEDLYSEFEKEMADPLVEHYVVSKAGQDFAFVQVCDAHLAGDGWWPDATPGTWAIDYLIGEPALIGKGLGTALISAFTEDLFARPGTHTVTADPEPGNIASIRACEKAGYTQAGLVKTPDCLSMLMVKTTLPGS
jgi:RimJ/RimL family protein N-acetyltransferase